jgi:hypothetical protein
VLRALPESRVLSEPSALNVALLAPEPSLGSIPRADLVRQVTSALGQPCRPGEKHFLLKLSSPTVLRLHLLRQIFPTVPWAFLYRHPVEVTLSNRLSPTGWLASRGWGDPVAINVPSRHFGAVPGTLPFFPSIRNGPPRTPFDPPSVRSTIPGNRHPLVLS